MSAVAESSKHSIIEDVQAIASATLIIALGVMVFKTAGLITGGTTGLALLLHYMTGWRFGLLLFVVNFLLHFYVINFDDPHRSHRCNPINPEFMTDISDAYEASYTIMLNLNKTWV